MKKKRKKKYSKETLSKDEIYSKEIFLKGNSFKKRNKFIRNIPPKKQQTNKKEKGKE